MATFVKCKEESVVRKTYKKEQSEFKIERVLLFFKSGTPVFKEVPGEDERVVNNPVNLDQVLDIEKVLGAGDRSSDWNYKEGTLRPGIKFDFGKYSTTWYYSDENLRDSQYEEIATNQYKPIKGEFRGEF